MIDMFQVWFYLELFFLYYNGGNSVKNHTDVLIFHTAICTEASQISLDATREIAMRLSLALPRYASEWRIIMNETIGFVLTSAMLGVGLAMDAFSVSMANGLNEPKMKKSKILGIALTFAIFQMLMPLIGWVCVHTIATHFEMFQIFIPWIALVLLGYIGINMIREAGEECECGECTKLSFVTLMIQGVATSIDALSVGFTISDYGFVMALVCSCIIALVTFVICVSGVIIGKKFGTKLAGKSSVLGGVILIIIGLKIFVDGVF